MNRKPGRNPVTYDVLTAGHATQSAALVARVFSQDEPLAVAAGQTEAELYAMMSAAAPSALTQALSIGAWSDGKLIGAAITTVFTWLPPADSDALSPRYKPIFALLAELEADFEARPVSELQNCAHLHMLAVERSFRDDRIAGKLVQQVVETASRKGLQEVVADATNPASQRVFARAGFERINTVRYDSFTFEDERVFSTIGNATETALMVRAL